MVAIYRKSNQITRLVLTPNRSLDWQGNVQIVLATAILLTIVSVPIVFMGGWVVIPFALIQLIALAIGLYLTLRKLSYHEVITLKNGNLSLERGSHKLETSSTFPKNSVRILVEEPVRPMDLPDIDLIAEGHCYPLGSFLNRSDRFKLEKILKNQLNLRISHLNSFHRVSF